MSEAEVVVIGAGPAGIAAAVASAESGADVLVMDDQAAPGGQIWRGAESTKEGAARKWVERFRSSGARVLSSAQVVAADARARTLLVETAEDAREIRFKKLILATGAREIFLPFPGWTLPGVMGVGGLQAMAKAGLAVAGKRVVIAGSGPLLLAVAAYLRAHGAQVKIIAEQAARGALARFAAQLVRHPVKMAQAAWLRASLTGVPYVTGCWVVRAEGNARVERVQLQRGDHRWTEECDYAAIAYGLYPNTELAALLDCRMDGESVAVDETGATSVEDVFCAGECTGIGGVDLSIAEGEIAGYAASGKIAPAQRLFARRRKARRFAESLNGAFALRPEVKGLAESDTLVCRCEDVAFQKLKKFQSFRAAKLQTRCGMGPCQARVCGPAMEYLLGWRPESIRPPVLPARVSSLVVGVQGK